MAKKPLLLSNAERIPLPNRLQCRHRKSRSLPPCLTQHPLLRPQLPMAWQPFRDPLPRLQRRAYSQHPQTRRLLREHRRSWESKTRPNRLRASTLCPVCLRSAGDFQHGDENSEPREVSLASIQSAAASCSLCRFVQEQLEQDDTTPKKDDSSYEIAKVRVQDDGLRFTGQWQGALVVEIYKPCESPLLVSESGQNLLEAIQD